MLDEKMGKVAKGKKKKKKKKKEKSVPLCSYDFMLKKLEIKRS
jgi:hypothetical protein